MSGGVSPFSPSGVFACCSNQLIGVDLKTLIGQGVQIHTNGPGTPGVNRRGSSEQDQRNVARRIPDIKEKVGPHAHTDASWAEYVDRINALTSHVIFRRDEFDRNGKFIHHVLFPRNDLEGIQFLHEKNKKLMERTCGKQLTAFVAGAGPIGLAACVAFYKRGFKVACFEKYTEEKFATREHPFGLEKRSYLALNGWGISSEKILSSIGRPITQKDIDRHIDRTPTQEFLDGLRSDFLFSGNLMREAKEQRIGTQAVDYQPNSTSLRTCDLQMMFHRFIGKLKQWDKQDLSLTFNTDCSEGWAVDGRGQKTFHGHSYDLIYNATGGKINEALGFTTHRIGRWYGMGAFYKAPPSKLDPSKISPLLSRAIRVFASVKEDQPIYCNIELSEEEFNDPKKKREIADMVAHDVGLGDFIRSFDVPIDLDNVEEAAKLANGQFIICGGDSLLKPHFMTASGANFGVLGLIELDRLIDQLIDKRIAAQQLVTEYNQMAKLLQKQSAQVIMDLFAQPLR